MSSFSSGYDSGSIALSDVPPPMRSGATVRPPGAVYRIEDRLPGVMGSMVPPPSFAVRAFSTAPPPASKSSGNARLLAGILVALVSFTGFVIYRDVNRAPPVVVPAGP